MKKAIYTTAALAGLFATAQGQTVVSGEIESDTTWDTQGSPYVLEDETFVKNGATLTILPGVVVRGQPDASDSNPGSLVVTRNGKIFAEGTREDPIIFTTAAVDTDGDDVPDDADDDGFVDRFDPSIHDASDFYDTDPKNNPLPPLAGTATPGNQATQAGDPNAIAGATGEGLSANLELWGGLLVLGNAPTNLGTSTGGSTDIGKEESLEGFIEGLTNSEDTAYGGVFANDSSGALEFISVRHGGKVIGTANEINGITFAGVGFGTKVENLNVYMTWDDGIEWFGGTVNGRNLAIEFAGDDQLDGDQGWIGQVQYAYAALPYFKMGSSSGDKLFEFDGEDGADAPDSNVTEDGDVIPYPSYAVANFTGVGPQGATDNQLADGSSGSIDMKAGFSGDLYNGFIVNTGATPFLYNSPEPIAINSVTFKDVGTPQDASQISNATEENIVDQGETGAGLVGEDASVAGGLDPRPATPFGVVGVDSDIRLPQPFETESFRGAFDPDAAELWTTGWTALNIRGILVD